MSVTKEAAMEAARTYWLNYEHNQYGNTTGSQSTEPLYCLGKYHAYRDVAKALGATQSEINAYIDNGGK
jgi:hypothetical protein